MAAEQNILEQFSVVNPLWTLYCVSHSDLNSNGYRNKEPSNVIASSAGRYDGQRVETIYGSPEFFIDEVNMTCLVTGTPGAGNSTQIKTTFEVFEPFSMTMFLQAMQIAALNCGYKDYLSNAAYILKLEFKGHVSQDEWVAIDPYYFVLKMINVEFSADQAGSHYKVEAIPFNHIAYIETVNTAKNDMKLIGKNAKEALVDHPTNSLIKLLNDKEAQSVIDKQKMQPDTYEIEFAPADWGGPNPFEPASTGDFQFTPNSEGGQDTYGRYSEDTDPVYGKVLPGKLTIDPKEQTFTFKQGTSLTNIIDAIILMTKEARENASDPSKIDSKGMVVWWRLDVKVKSNLDKYDEARKDYAKTYTFVVIPFKLHHTVYSGPETSAKGIADIKKEIIKEYDYIYTGLNTSVLKFNIDIKNLFYTAIDPNKPEHTATSASAGTNAKVAPDVETTEHSTGIADVSESNNTSCVMPSVRIGNDRIRGGSGRYDTKQKVADDFYYAAINKTVDMINLDMEILGDPYWLPENGQGNYFPNGGGTPKAGNTMNYQNRDLFISVNFKTPIDPVTNTGLYQFPEPKSPFSGIYKVTKVEHRFSGGTYVNRLTGFRVPAQDISGGGDPYPRKITDVAVPRTEIYMSPGQKKI